MSAMSTEELRSVVAEVLAELAAGSDAPAPTSPARTNAATTPTAPTPPVLTTPAAPSRSGPEVARKSPGSGDVSIEVPDPTVAAERHRIGVRDAANPSGLENLAASTSARLAVGRAGPRPPTRSVLLFGADHAVTQDAIFGDVPSALLDQFGLFTVQTRVSTQDEYLLRPDLGRELDEDSKRVVAEKCVKQPQVQVVVGDGLSAAAVTNNLPQIYPVLEQGLRAAGLTLGTPFFVRYCRVGVINDVNDIVRADVVLLLIGERPGLGVADAMSVYSGWQPTAGKTDAHRDVICMITENGGTNPLEAGAFVVEHVKNVMKHQASGVELRLLESGSR